MVICKKLLCVLFISLLISSLVSAKSKKKKTGLTTSAAVASEDKERGEEDSSASKNDEEAQSAEAAWQLLEWDEDYPEYVQKYEIVIEEKKDEKTGWTEINRLFTEDNTTAVQIQPLLMPGLYRYKVITYDLIGIPEIESDWFEFNIYRAFLPQVRGVEANVTHSSTIYLDEVNDGLFTVTGRNLFELQEGPLDLSFTNYSLVNAKRKNAEPLIPEILEFSDNNRKLKVQFDMNILDSGTYYFTATDASGLESEHNKDSILTVKFRKAVDFDVSAGYTCPIIVAGDKIKEYLNTTVLPLSANAKATFMPFKRRFGYLGIGADAVYSRLVTKTEGYELDGNYICANGILVYQLPIRIKSKVDETKLRHIATIEVHAGAGVSMFQNTVFHFPHDINSEALNSINLSAMAGVSGQVYFTNRLYAEIGVDFVMPFIQSLPMGYIKPVAAVGWQF